MAGGSIRFSLQCKDYYLKKTGRGEGSKVIYKMLTEDRDYMVKKELKKVA